MTYTVTCDISHEPETMTVEAATDEEALEKLLEMGKAHNDEKHAEMKMSDEEFKTYIQEHWEKS
jgi:hypothetical protein